MINKDRQYIIDFLNEVEINFPVYKWRVHEIDIWPLLKMQLFFGFYNKHLNKQVKDSKYFTNKIINRLKLEFSKIKNVKSTKIQELTIEPRDILFLAPYNARVIYENKSINRFFDPLMDSIDYSSYLLEYNYTDVIKFYKKERIINAGAFYTSFKRDYVNQSVEFECLEKFKEFLIFMQKQGVGEAESVLKKLKGAIREIIIWSKVWDFFIQKTSPKLAVVNCYYNLPMFGFLIAAKKANIPAVDMQHGGLGASHPLYSFCNFDNSKCHNLIPDFFWVWDKSTKSYLETFIDPNRVINGGNTWIDYSNSRIQAKSLCEKKIILYTLQDGNYFPQKIVQAIKEKGDEYQWWIRMHPRTPKSEVDRIHKEFVQNEIEEFVELKKANTLPLPEILNHTHIHVSRFSGSIIEAAVLGVPYNITISKIGKENYQNLIDSNQLHYFEMESDDSFFNFIDKLSPIKNIPSNISHNTLYNKIIEKTIKKYKRFKGIL